MKKADMDQIIRETPVTVAIFRVKKVPNWAAGYTAIGEEVFWCRNQGTMRTVKVGQGHSQRMNLDIRSSYLEFVEYANIERG